MHTVFLSPGLILGRKEGHPSIWYDGRLHEAACRWLNEEIVPRSLSQATWAQAARALASWLDFCLESRADWKHASRDDLLSYRDAYLGAISPVTGRQYSPNTVRTRMTYIIDFIEYSTAQGWSDSELATVPVSISIDRPRLPLNRDALAHTRKGKVESVGRSVRKLMPRVTQDETIRFLRREELNTLLRWAGPRPSKRIEGDDVGCGRDRIVFDMAWAVGLRVEEIASLKIYPFEEMVPDPAYPGMHFGLSVTGKGRKTRRVNVPVWLVIDIHAYIAGERKRALARRAKKINESQLILNSEYSRNRPGSPMTVAGMKALVARACEGAGLMHRVERINPETREVVAVSKPRFSMHCLRHTYAVMMYQSLKESRFDNYEIWKYIQNQLGHSSPTTTMDYYLKHVEAWPHTHSSQTLLEMLGAWKKGYP